MLTSKIDTYLTLRNIEYWVVGILSLSTAGLCNLYSFETETEFRILLDLRNGSGTEMVPNGMVFSEMYIVQLVEISAIFFNAM